MPVTIQNIAPLTINASSPTITYGSPVPEITATFASDGFIGTDSTTALISARKQPTCTTTYSATGPNSAVGTYPTTCASAVDADYTISYSAGTLTVTGATPTWTNFNAMTITYGTPLPLTATASGATPTYTISSSSHAGPYTTILAVPATTVPGIYYVTATVAATGNYAAASTQRTLTVNPAILTITPAVNGIVSTSASPSATLTYGSAIPTYSVIPASYYGFLNGDGPSAVTGTFTCTSDYTQTSPVAHYITNCKANTATSANYTFDFVDGAFAVTQALPKVTVWPTSSGSYTYGTQLLSPITLLQNGTVQNPNNPAVTVGGTWTWTTPANRPGVTSSLGSNQSVTFTPTDTADYSSVTSPLVDYVAVTVTALTPTVSGLPTASPITTAQYESASTLSGGSVTGIGGATVPGTWIWGAGASTTNPTQGANPGVAVTFDPSSANYSPVSRTVTINATGTALTVATLPTASTITYGQELASSKLTGGSVTASTGGGTATVAGTWTWTSPTTMPSVNGPAQALTFTPTNIGYSPLTTPTLVPTVHQASSTTALTVTGTDTYGSTQTMNATVTPAAATGTVNFKDGTITRGTCALDGITGACTAPITYSLSIGSHSLTAAYVGGGNSAASTSSVRSITISKAIPTVTVSPSSSDPTYGTSMTLSAAVSTAGTGNAPTGTVDFLDTTTGIDLGTVPLTAGSTSPLTVSTLLPLNANGISATYSGDAYYTTANNTATSLNVTANPCGLQDSINLTLGSNAGFAETQSLYSPLSDPSVDVFGDNESAICAVDTSSTFTVNVTSPTITSEATSTYAADSSSDGTNAAVLAYGYETTAGTGAAIIIAPDNGNAPSSITTSNNNSNGVVASMGGTVTIGDPNGVASTSISTSGNSSHALDATKAGTLTIYNVTGTTTGNNSAVIATGMGVGNTAMVTGGTYTASGTNSAGIRAAGNGSTITIADGTTGTTITAQGGPAVVINGGNSVTINSANSLTSLSGALGNNQGIFLYYSSSKRRRHGWPQQLQHDQRLPYLHLRCEQRGILRGYGEKYCQ